MSLQTDAQISDWLKRVAHESNLGSLTEAEVKQGIAEYRELVKLRGFGPDQVGSVVVHHEPTLRMDPAIERWRTMRDSIHQGFRFTRYNTGPAMFWGAAVPLAFFTMAWYTKDRWSWAGKGRGESLLKHPPKTEGAQ